jgi:uncharacterized protein (TIGR02391 family)
MASRPPRFTVEQLEAIAKELGDTSTGLTGSEIGHILARVDIEDVSPDLTKWKRLFNALVTRQNRDQSGHKTLAFINAALRPERYAGNQSLFQLRRRAVNVPLAFYGLEYTEDGKFHRCSPAATLSEAERRASKLRDALQQRNVEAEVLHFCRAELLEDNYFHAVLEATKSVAATIRLRTGLTSDGAELAQVAFGGSAPLLRINSFSSRTQESEQRGFVNLLVGFFGTFRNPTAHAPRIAWPMSEKDALDLLSLASYIVRRVNSATIHQGAAP